MIDVEIIVEMELKVMDKKIKHGLLFFYAVSLVITGLIIYFTSDHHTWQQILNLKLNYLFLTLVLTIMMWLFDFMRLKELAKGIGENISLSLGLKLVWANLFLAAVTPFQTGGGPMQVYLMYKKSQIDAAKGVVITSMKFIIALLFFAVVSPIIVILYPDLLPKNQFRYLFYYIIFFFVVVGVIYLLTIIFPRRIKKLLYRIINVIDRFSFWNSKYTTKLLKFGLSNINEFNIGFKVYLTKNRKNLLLSIGYTMLFLLAQFSIPVLLIKSLGIEVSSLQVILNQFILTTLMYFTPTPGGSGMAEGGFMVLFLQFVPRYSIGILILLWRFFVIYLGVFFGSYVFIKLLGEVTLGKIMNLEKERS
ncbi:MAG: lysylphosphatidylglycerol synthase transmembrane domain-containing protein [Bacillota bacterium]